MQKITIVSCCYSRDEQLQCVLPSWLVQEDVEIDIVLVVGPSIEKKPFYNITYVDWPDKEFTGCSNAWNVGYKAANAPLIYSAYSDMVLQDKHYIARMLAHYKPGRVINRQLDRPDGTLDEGLWCYGFLSGKELLLQTVWDERYNGGYAWEDTDYIHRLVEAGAELAILKPLPADLALKHIDHPSVRDAGDWHEKYIRNKHIYNHRFPKETLMDMYRQGRFKVYEDHPSFS